jgi:hypothetical protein
MMKVVFSVALLTSANSFNFKSFRNHFSFILKDSTTFSSESKSWQEDVDSILNIDTSCDTRREKVSELLSKSSSVVEDIVSAVTEKDIKKVAPPNLSYGKAVQGLQAFRNQLFSDIIPGLIFNDAPKLIQESPKLINDLVTDGPKTLSNIISRSQELVTDITQDPSRLQSTVDDLRREVKNVVRSTPEGLQSPEYSTLKTTDNYEVRQYASYSVCSTELEVDTEDKSSTMNPIVTGKGFNKLADYIFGKQLSMTTPVIISSGSMEFVLPSGLTMSSAPLPDDTDVLLKDVTPEVVATREFTGLATDGEVMRQRTALEDALLADGITYDNLSFRVLQYNPPYTLPWLRRNEVVLKLVDYPITEPVINSTDTPVEEFKSADSSEFISSPEAGD